MSKSCNIQLEKKDICENLIYCMKGIDDWKGLHIHLITTHKGHKQYVHYAKPYVHAKPYGHITYIYLTPP